MGLPQDLPWRHMAGSSAFPACRTGTAGSGKRPPAGNRRSPSGWLHFSRRIAGAPGRPGRSVDGQDSGKERIKTKNHCQNPDPRRKNPLPGMGQTKPEIRRSTIRRASWLPPHSGYGHGRHRRISPRIPFPGRPGGTDHRCPFQCRRLGFATRFGEINPSSSGL